MINFDICNHFETGRDFGHGDGNCYGKFGKRSSLSNTQCHAQEDGKVCRRRGRCVVARDNNWKLISKKSFQK
jgi:hypothetical protein